MVPLYLDGINFDVNANGILKIFQQETLYASAENSIGFSIEAKILWK